MQTIFAQATAAGRAGIAVVRLSGPLAVAAAERLCGPLGPPRQMVLRGITAGGMVFDRGLVVYFPAGASFTGDDLVEFHVHGSVAVLHMLLDALGTMPDLRLAEPGEFTRRALDSGRLDLTQVEALADLIDAETEAQLRQSVRVLSGELAGRVSGWRRDLIRCSALMAAAMDFSDEDIPGDVMDGAARLVAGVLAELRCEIGGYAMSARLRTGYEVAIVGAPNSGKSTLLNRIARREAAITSPIAGTTRDVIEVRTDVGGLPVTFLDTAGLHDAEDAIEVIGVQRALKRAALADLRLLLAERAGQPHPLPMGEQDLVYMAKVDDADDASGGISGLTGAGVDAMLARVAEKLRGNSGSDSLINRPRHVQAMTSAVADLAAALDELAQGEARIDIAADLVRQAVLGLDILVGKVGVEDVLDEVFRSFCLGK